MGSRKYETRQLSNGLFVSGPTEPPKERPTLGLRAVPYTGGDVKKSGELGKMFDIPTVDPATPSPPPKSRPNSGSARSASSSGPQPPKKTSSGPLAPTGLITSGPARRSGGQGQQGSQTPWPRRKPGDKYGPAVTSLGVEFGYGFGVPKLAVVLVTTVLAIGVLAGCFLMFAAKKVQLLVAVVALAALLFLWAIWNWLGRRRGLELYLRSYPDTDLREDKIGSFVKVTGVVTCGSIPLETSYQGVSRCAYASTELYEYRGWRGRRANPYHKCLTWGSRHSEKYVADFYISENKRGTRALVRAGNGAKVAPFVKPVIKVEVTRKNRELSPAFQAWLGDHNLTSDDRVMRLKEGYIKEGSIISVMGVLRRQDNVLMIVPPEEPISTGWQWGRCLLPMHIESLVLIGEENIDDEVVTA